MAQLARLAGLLARDRRAGVGVLFATTFPTLLGAGALAVDASKIYQQRGVLQAAADSAAIASATELRIASADARRIAGVAVTYVAAKLGAEAPPAPQPSSQTTSGSTDSGPQASTATLHTAQDDTVTVTTVYDGAHATVEVRLKQEIDTILAQYLSQGMTTVAVSSTARMMGAAPLCMVGLDEVAKDTVKLENGSKATGNGCAIYSNSAADTGLNIDSSSSLQATKVCSVTVPKKANSTPPPVACPPLRPDPLSYRKALPYSCPLGVPPLVISGTATVVLPPGFYCGGVTVKDSATLVLSGTVAAPGGVYVMGGDLALKNQSSIKMLDASAGAAFYFTGAKSRFIFDDNVTVSLSAPRTGELAGFLFFEDPSRASSGAAPLMYEIKSKKVSQLLGTIYIKNGVLNVDLNLKGPGAIADQSAFTVVVARRIQLKDGPNLVLNSNYAGTSVPVPEGVGPTGGIIAIAK